MASALNRVFVTVIYVVTTSIVLYVAGKSSSHQIYSQCRLVFVHLGRIQNEPNLVFQYEEWVKIDS